MKATIILVYAAHVQRVNYVHVHVCTHTNLGAIAFEYQKLVYSEKAFVGESTNHKFLSCDLLSFRC